jgi:two-component system LytT family response regulator
MALLGMRPTLLMLDILMPEQDGISAFLEIPPKKRPLVTFVTFVTAHEEFALTAFHINAVDYLLKPIDRIRLATLARDTFFVHAKL